MKRQGLTWILILAALLAGGCGQAEQERTVEEYYNRLRDKAAD